MAKTIFRKMAAFFGPKPKRARRARSQSHLGSTISARSSLRSSSSSYSRESSSRSTVIQRVKSWYKRVTTRGPAGYFTVDVGHNKIRYRVPLAYFFYEDLQMLLEDSVAEFGWTSLGPLHLACNEDELLEVLDTVRICLEGVVPRPTERLYQLLVAGKPH